MALGKEKEGGNYISFKPSIGRLAIKSDKSDPEAKPRTYTDQKTKEEVTVYEKRVPNIDGFVVGVKTATEGIYGPQLLVTLRDEGTPDYTLAIPLNKKYGTKIAERVANLKLDEKVFLNAFGEFIGNDGKTVDAGVSVEQNGEKVFSYFNFKEGDKWVIKDGFPEYPASETIPNKDKNPAKYTKFWSDYYFTVTEFLVDWFDKNMTIEYTPVTNEETEEKAEEVQF